VTTGAGKEDLDLGVSDERLTLAAYISDVGARFADHEAVVSAGTRLTYRELLAETRRLAKSLVAAGVTKGSKVGVLVANRPEFIIASFAISLAGGIIVPISTLATPEERYQVLRHSDASILMMQDRLRNHEYLADLGADHPGLFDGEPGALADPAFPYLRRIVMAGATTGTAETWDTFAGIGAAIPDRLLDAVAGQVTVADDAIIIYTSGTTAMPKAVLHTHRSVTVQMWRWARQLGLSVADRVWSAYPFFWTAGFSMLLGGTLSSGAALILQEVFEPAETLELIERERITTIYSLEHTDSQLASHPDARIRDLSSLAHVRQSSSLRNIIGRRGKDWDPRSGYGSSETFTISTALPAGADPAIRSASHGRPLPGMQIGIVDPDTGAPVETAQTGEIVVKGVTLMRSYYKLPIEDALDDNGWFHTSDAGYLDAAGYLHWSGRISGLIKTAGANVSPVEVENCAAGLKMLGLTAVVGIPHPTLGEAVVLAGVALPGVELDVDRLTQHLREHLASYKVPKRVLLFDDADLAFTANEKVRIDRVRHVVIDRLICSDPDEEWVGYLRTQVGG
jgi:fatty-acyl-CoA synthase